MIVKARLSLVRARQAKVDLFNRVADTLATKAAQKPDKGVRAAVGRFEARLSSFIASRMERYHAVTSEAARAKPLRRADADETVTLSFVLHGRNREEFNSRLDEIYQHDLPYMTREEYAEKYGADPADLAAVEAFAKAHGLEVVLTHQGMRRVSLRGKVAQFDRALKIDIERFEYRGRTHLGSRAPVVLPKELWGKVQSIHGLGPAAHSHLRPGGPKDAAATGDTGRAVTPTEVAAHYGFGGARADGQTIGIIELGGGYNLADLQANAQNLGIPVPQVTAVGVLGATSQPSGNPDDSNDQEVALDIQAASSVAIGAKIPVYFAPNDNHQDCISAAVHDTVNRPSVLSDSWGESEDSFTPDQLQAYAELLKEAAALGVTFVVASGDYGVYDSNVFSMRTVDAVSSFPQAFGAGGTIPVFGANGKIASERAWVHWENGKFSYGSGGGESSKVAIPLYQQGKTIDGATGRCVPDFAANAERMGIFVNGSSRDASGTSGSAPLIAAIIAIMNARRGKNLGDFHPQLYANAATWLTDIGPTGDPTQDTNGNPPDGCSVLKGYDLVTGLGSPNASFLQGS
jgi:kumamolisin